MKKIVTMVAAAVVSVPFFQLSSAGGLKLVPGKWEHTTTIEMSMMPGPRVVTRTKCITEAQAERDPLAAMVKEGNCTVLKREESGDSIEFEFECTGDPSMPAKSRGKGAFTASGKTASGWMDATVDIPEMPDMPDIPGMPDMGGVATMSQQWEGRYLGPCD